MADGKRRKSDRSTAHFIEAGPKEKLEVVESLAVTGPTLLKTAVEGGSCHHRGLGRIKVVLLD